MQQFWYLFYNGIVIPVFWLLLGMGFPFNAKIRKALRGRRALFSRLESGLGRLTAPRRIWFHSSSMGEFEQAKPIIASLKQHYADVDIIVSFFSPSGYEHSQAYKQASLITYLPFDTISNARRFLDLVKPSAAIMVRYDLWPNHIRELHRRNIPTFIANATLRRNSSRHWPLLRNFNKHLYEDLTSILTVSKDDVTSFLRLGVPESKLYAIGETRYDQVWQRSIDARTKHLIPPALLRGKKIFVVGSSWNEDETVVLAAFRRLVAEASGVLMILVPHEPTLETLDRLAATLNSSLRSIRFSDLNDYTNEKVVLVDSIGILVPLYQYAHVAYVGGSFRQGIHNVLEPAVYGIPVLYGPKHENSQEAIELVRRGGGFVVTNEEECFRQLKKLLTDEKSRENAGAVSLNLVKENIGATERFIEHLAKSL